MTMKTAFKNAKLNRRMTIIVVLIVIVMTVLTACRKKMTSQDMVMIISLSIRLQDGREYALKETVTGSADPLLLRSMTETGT